MQNKSGSPRRSVGAAVPKALRSAKHPATWSDFSGGPRRSVGAGACSSVFGASVPKALRSAKHPATWGAL